VKRTTGYDTSLMTLKIPVAHCRFLDPAELVGQMDQDHCLSTVAAAVGSAGRGVAGEVPVAAVVG